MMPPYDKLKSLPNAAHHLNPGVTCESPDALAHRISDDGAAEHLRRAKHLLLKTILGQRIGVV